jgi:hypothetical protein
VGKSSDSTLTPSAPPAVEPSADRLQSLLIRGGGAPDVHVSLIVGGGQNPTPAVVEARVSAPERAGERVATVEAADRSGAPPGVGGLEAHSPRAGFVKPPGEKGLDVLQDVSSPTSDFFIAGLPLDLFAGVAFCLLVVGVLSLAPLKRLALSAWVVSSETRPQPPSVESLQAWAEEEPVVVAAMGASGAPLPSVPSTAVEEGQMAAGATAPQANLELPVEAGPSGGDVVVILDEDSAPPPPSGGRDVVMAQVSEPAHAAVTVDPFPTVEVLEPSLAPEVPGPSPTAEAANTSAAADAVTGR